MKTDLVIWTKNSAKILPLVLQNLEKVLPEESLHKRLIVDDKSVDETVSIAKAFGCAVTPGWKAAMNSEQAVQKTIGELAKEILKEKA